MSSLNLLIRGVAGAACCRRALHPPITANKLTLPLSFPSFPYRSRLMSSLSAANRHKESIRNMNDAGFDMAQHLISGEAKDRNLVFSPLSIHSLLSSLTEGATGATKDKLLPFLKAKSPSHLHSLYSDLVVPVLADGSPAGGPKLSTANGIWTDKSVSLKPGFKQVVDSVYQPDTSQVDFQNKPGEAEKQINLWVEDKTKGLIKDILSLGSIDPLTRLVCANTLYFNGAWSQEFDTSLTEKDDFYLSDGSRVNIPFMTNWERQAVGAYDGFKVLRLPYKQGDDKREYSMYIILPDAKDGLSDLTKRVCSESGFLDSHIPKRKVKMGEFRIPKLNISYEFEVLPVLKRLGFPSLFDVSEMADSDDPMLEVSRIIHKAVIEVDEKGTEAAAATISIALGSCRYPLPPPEPEESFVADHPFMYAIREDTTGTVLFIGHVLNPLAD